MGQIVPVLDYRGLLDRLREEATYAWWYRASFGPLELDLSRLGTSPLHILRCRDAGWRRCWKSGSPNSAGPSGAGTS